MEPSRDHIKQKIEKMRTINYKQEKRLNYFEKSAYRITSFYFIFQGMIFISISKRSSSLPCYHWWIPFTLSLLSSTIYGLTFFSTLTNCIQTLYHLDLNRLELELMIQQLHMGEQQGNQMTQDQLKPDKVQWLRRYALVYLVVLVMLAFAGIMLYACHSFLCNK